MDIFTIAVMGAILLLVLFMSRILIILVWLTFIIVAAMAVMVFFLGFPVREVFDMVTQVILLAF
jgi:hypothetical protein